MEKTPDVTKYAALYAAHWGMNMKHTHCFDRFGPSSLPLSGLTANMYLS